VEETQAEDEDDQAADEANEEEEEADEGWFLNWCIICNVYVSILCLFY